VVMGARGSKPPVEAASAPRLEQAWQQGKIKATINRQ